MEASEQWILMQIYRLLATPASGRRNVTCQPARPTVVAIGGRRRTKLTERRGFLRIGAVHPGWEVWWYAREDSNL